jgi:L-asparaginase/Glu-tRNA(Gln) amidotransferase subunit D
MLFFISAPGYNSSQFNATKIRVHLRSGVAEVLPGHQAMLGKVDQNIIEVETNFENKSESFLYVAQQAVFVVSEGGTIDTPEAKDTKIVVYAKNVRELTSRGPIDEIQKEYDSKIGELERKTGKDEITPSELLVLKEDISFLSKVLEVAKTSKR